MATKRSLAYDRHNLFGPVNVNLMEAGDTDIVTLNDVGTKFFPTSFRVFSAYQRGTLATTPIIVFDTGTNAENISASLTMTSVAEGTNFHIAPPATVLQTVTGEKKVRLKKSTLANGQATATRLRENNVATLTTAVAHGFAVGDLITVRLMTDSTYDGVSVPVLSVPSSTSFTYANEGVDEAVTADTAGRVGALLIQVWVLGIYW